MFITGFLQVDYHVLTKHKDIVLYITEIMTVLVGKNEKSVMVLREAERLVGPNFIGVRTKRLLVKTDEKKFNGVSGTFLSGNGTTIEKLSFLFGKTGSNLSYKGGRMEICIS